MIIECESCSSKFNLDESLVNEKGSKVRCSVCKNTFVIHPPAKEPLEEPLSDVAPESDDLGKTISLDAPPVADDKDTDPGEGDVAGVLEDTMDDVFQQAIDEIDAKEEPALDHPPELEEDEPVDMEEARQRATRIEEEVTREDQKKKVTKKPQSIARESVRKPAKEPPPPPAKAKPRPFLSLPLVGGGIVLLLVVAVSIYFFMPDLIPDSLSVLKSVKKEDITDVGVRRLAFKAVSGSFVQSTREGQLFVVKGVVTNNYPHKRSFILIKATILDNNGDVAKRKMVYAGNIFTKNQIRELPLTVINKGLKNRYGKGRMNLNIEPDNSIPFMAIFDNLPENMSEFTVEAVSSAKGE